MASSHLGIFVKQSLARDSDGPVRRFPVSPPDLMVPVPPARLSPRFPLHGVRGQLMVIFLYQNKTVLL